MSRPLKFVSFNARGLRDAVKRRAVFRHLHIKYPGHLAILQETHSAADVERRWKTEWGGDVLFSHGENNARGVCVLVPGTFNGDVKLVNADDDGRMIAMNVELNNLTMNMMGIYAPTQSNPKQQE